MPIILPRVLISDIDVADFLPGELALYSTVHVVIRSTVRDMGLDTFSFFRNARSDELTFKIRTFNFKLYLQSLTKITMNTSSNFNKNGTFIDE